MAFGGGVAQDNFDDNLLNPDLWTPESGSGITVAEKDGHLQLDSAGGAGEAGISFNRLLDAGFDASIDFDSSGCVAHSVLSVNVQDNSGEHSFSFLNGIIAPLASWGTEEARYWVLKDNKSGNIYLADATTVESGTFYVGYNKMDDSIYFGDDETNPAGVIGGISSWGDAVNISFTLCNSGAQAAAGSFDNFEVVPEPMTAMLFGVSSLMLFIWRRKRMR